MILPVVVFSGFQDDDSLKKEDLNINRAILGTKSHVSPFKMRTFKPETTQPLFIKWQKKF